MPRYDYGGRTDQRKVAWKRWSDAVVLLEHPQPHRRGAMYLAGYAIKCKLKAVAMEIFDCWTLNQLAEVLQIDDRDVHTHRLERFAKRLPLYDRLTHSHVGRDFASQVNRWKPAWRYDWREPEHDQAFAFLHAVKRVYIWLDSNR